MKNYTNFRTTSDENITLADIVTVEELYMDKLQNQIDELTKRINNLLEPIVCPKDATDEIKMVVEFWNLMNVPSDRETIEVARQEIQDLIDVLNNL